MKFSFLLVCFSVFSSALLFSQEAPAEQSAPPSATEQEKAPEAEERIIVTNQKFKKNSRGTGYGLVLGGTVSASLGTVLEATTILTYFLLDDTTRTQVSTDSNVFTFLHISSAAFITAGVAAVIAGTTYVDDSVYGKNYWKKTQIITGSVFTSVGAATTIAGSVLYAALDMKDVGSGIIGGGASLMASGITSLFIGLFAR